MVLNDLVDSFCYSQKNAGLKGLMLAKPLQCIHSTTKIRPVAYSKPAGAIRISRNLTVTMHTTSLKNQHWDYMRFTTAVCSLRPSTMQNKLSYGVKLTQKYWRQTSPKSNNNFSIYYFIKQGELLYETRHTVTHLNISDMEKTYKRLPTRITALTSLPSFKRQLKTQSKVHHRPITFYAPVTLTFTQWHDEFGL